MNARIVLSIPGAWKTREELVQSISALNASESAKYIAVGPMLLNSATNFGCFFSVYDRDPSLTKAFEIAGQGRFKQEELEAIERHSLLACLDLPDPTVTSARCILRAGACILQAGGLAILVASSGNAQPRSRWIYYAENCGMLSRYDAFVTLVGGDDFNYTCGMHAFGLPDASVSAEFPIEQAPEVLNAFNQWQLLERPALSPGQLFATGLEEQRFTISHCAYGYDEDDAKNNAHGRYHLTPTDRELPDDLNFKKNTEPLFSGIKRSDTLSCKVQAQDSLSYFLRHFECPFEYGTCMFKTLVKDGGHEAYMWLNMIGVDEDRFAGVLFELPKEFPNLRAGMHLRVPKDEIVDWCVIRNATLIGGYTMRLQREHVEPTRRRLADLYAGTISYAPLDELS